MIQENSRRIKRIAKDKITFKPETEEEKLLRYMNISPKKKLEWMAQMHKFFCLAHTKRQLEIYRKLREDRLL